MYKFELKHFLFWFIRQWVKPETRRRLNKNQTSWSWLVSWNLEECRFGLDPLLVSDITKTLFYTFIINYEKTKNKKKLNVISNCQLFNLAKIKMFYVFSPSHINKWVCMNIYSCHYILTSRSSYFNSKKKSWLKC